MPYLGTPDGTKIVGTLESLEAVANLIADRCEINRDGKVDVFYEGTTDPLWHSQITVEEDGHRQFVDEDGELWDECDLVMCDD